MPLIGLTLAVLMGMGGIGVDVGYLEYRQQAQQTATDAAAAGGAEALLRAGCPNSAAALTAAKGDAANNGFTNGSNNVTVTVSNPPAGGPFANNNCAVLVSIQTQQVATFFSRLFGFSNGATETTQAAAIVSGSGTACIYLLSPTVQSDLSNFHINAPGCGIVINDSANMSNSTIDMNSITYAGPAPNISGATFPEAAPVRALPVSDPCSRIPGCSYLTNNPPTTAGCGAGGTINGGSVSQGCYNKLTLSGTVTMGTGIYVINGQFHLNNATVTSAPGGVTIYMTSNVQDTNFSSAILNLSPMTSGNTAGVLMYRVPSQTAALDFSTCTCNLGGLLYFPTSQVNYSNTGSQYSVLVFGNANFSNSNGIDQGPPPVGQSLINQAVVAE